MIDRINLFQRATCAGIPYFVIVVLASAAVPGCTNPGSEETAEADTVVPSLLGHWRGDDETTLVFQPDSSALWIFPGDVTPDTFTVQYRFDPQSPNPALDLLGFDRGFLEGQTLYCIVELPDDDQMRMDCEPGPENGQAAGVRPEAFDPEQTRTYTRRLTRSNEP